MVGFDGRELAREAGSYHIRYLPRISEIAIAQKPLLPSFEGWHPKVKAAGTAESITQVEISTSQFLQAENSPVPLTSLFPVLL